MDNNKFLKLCIEKVVEYTNENLDGLKEPITKDDVYVVWISKIIGNNKAMLGTNLSDGKYYEITYNGQYDDLYVDVYGIEDSLNVSNVSE